MKLANTRRETSSAPILGLLLLAAVAIGCGGGSGGGPVGPGVAADFTDSGSVSAADVVRLGGSAAGDLVVVEVMIGGPTTSTDLYSFAFDLVLGDPTVAEYVSGSASAGTALEADGGQTVQALAGQQGNRVTVGVTKLGGGSGNGVGATGEAPVVELTFRLLQPGSTTVTIEGSPGNDPVALDSTGSEIGSVSFDPAAATLSGI